MTGHTKYKPKPKTKGWKQSRTLYVLSMNSSLQKTLVQIQRRTTVSLKKKKYNLKVKNYVFLGRLSEYFKPRSNLSDSSKRLLQGGKEETRIYRCSCNKDQLVGTSEDYY